MRGWVHPQEARDLKAGGHEADVEVTAVFADIDVSRLRDGDVVDAAQRGGVAQRGLVVEDLELPGPHVVGPDTVVALRREVDDAVVKPRALTTVEMHGGWDLVSGRRSPGAGVGDGDPADPGAGGHRKLEQPGAEVGVVGGGEAIKAAVGAILGQVDPLLDRVD